MQFVQRYMTNARTLRIHELTRHAIETATRELPPPEHPTVEIVDAYPLSEMRDDNTKVLPHPLPLTQPDRCAKT